MRCIRGFPLSYEIFSVFVFGSHYFAVLKDLQCSSFKFLAVSNVHLADGDGSLIMFISDDIASGHIAFNRYFLISVGDTYFVDSVLDLCTFFFVHIESVPGVCPSFALAQGDRISISLAVRKQLHCDLCRASLVHVVIVFPDFLDRDVSLLSIVRVCQRSNFAIDRRIAQAVTFRHRSFYPLISDLCLILIHRQTFHCCSPVRCG